MKLFSAALTLSTAFYASFANGQCDPTFTKLDLGPSTLVSNNLGVKNGELRYENVGYYDNNKKLDLRVTITNGKKHGEATKKGDFGTIELSPRPEWPNSGLGNFKFCLVDTGTNKPVKVKSFSWTVYDLDLRGKDDGTNGVGLREEMRIAQNEYKNIQVYKNTQIVQTCENSNETFPNCSGRVVFAASRAGTGEDNPTSIDSLTPIQKKRSIAFNFEETDCWEFSYNHYCPVDQPGYSGPETECRWYGGGNFLFSGESELIREEAICPTDPPTKEPTKEPTKPPTKEPTKEPTKPPTKPPTTWPTKKPTEEPTKKPTEEPTKKPTEEPTKKPTEEPTKKPTDEPTKKPTDEPTKKPTDEPTNKPTDEPTNKPTDEPTNKPTDEPTNKPTDEPTNKPTDEPTMAPADPTIAPVVPTEEPTMAPNHPTFAPVEPTDEPTNKPTDEPTNKPTDEPTNKPTDEPTMAPVDPTIAPVVPTVAPVEPTVAPVEPTVAPVEPTVAPVEPTVAPVEPTVAPVEPTVAPVEPTVAPVEPTVAPVEPTVAPVEPTVAPVEPTVAPVEPTESPTDYVDPNPPTPSLCPEDVGIIKQIGDTPIELGSAVQIVSYDTSTVTVKLNNAWTDSNFNVEQIFYQYKVDHFDEECFQKQSIAGDTNYEEITIQCMVSKPFAQLEICIADNSGAVNIGDSAEVPKCCKPKPAAETPTACYILEVKCETTCIEDVAQRRALRGAN